MTDLSRLKIDTMLDDLYERFSADASRIQEAQQNLSKAWQNLYHKLTSSSTGKEEGSKEKAIAGVNSAIAVKISCHFFFLF